MKDDWSRAGFWGSEEGKESLFLPEQGGIFIPPQVKVEGPFLVYLPWPNKEDLKGMPAAQIGSVHSRWIIPWLLKNGWRRQEKTSRLLNDFVSLPEVNPETAGKYVAFAKKYGPLWQQGIIDGKQLLFAWRDARREVGAAFGIASALKEGKMTNVEDWDNIRYPDGEDDPPEFQRQMLAAIINSRLEGTKLCLAWDNSPKITIDTGLGFLNVAWLQVAQMLTGKFSVCICSGCGRTYVRQGRIPQKGRKNFCDECGEKAAKRLWWRENRAQDFTKTGTKTGG